MKLAILAGVILLLAAVIPEILIKLKERKKRLARLSKKPTVPQNLP